MDNIIIFAEQSMRILCNRMKEGFVGERSIVLPKAVVEMEQNDPLVSSLYITDIGYYPCARDHYRERKEPIQEHVLIYCVEGAGWYQLGKNEYRVSANQFFILPAGIPHAYGADANQPWTIYWIHFTGEHAAIYSQDANLPQDLNPSVHSRIRERNTVFEEIINTIEKSYDRESLRYASSLLHYYLASMRYLRLYRQTQPSSIGFVEAVTHYMVENMEKKVTLQELADYMGYSQSYLSQRFKQELGESPLNYLNRLRIDNACRMLKETNLRINHICHKVGISDAYYFSRLFHQIMGMSPREYRK